MERPPARSAEQRRKDSLARLENDVDLWVATADPDSGRPYLIPLSFLWDGSTILIATPASSVTGRNLQATGIVHLGVGLVRDVTLIEGTVEVVPAADISDELGETFATKTGFDPRAEPQDYLYFRIRPQRLRTWREANELTGRTLLRDGRWLVE